METKTKVMLAGGGIVIVGGFITFLVIRKRVKLKRSINQYGKTSVPGAGINLTEVVQQLAMDLGTYYGSWDPRHWTENDDEVIKDVLKIPKTLMPQAIQIYFKNYKSDLRNDLQRTLPIEGWNEVKYLF